MARGDQLSRQWRLIRFLDHPNGFTVDLTFHQGGLYLIGHCHTRKDLRIFAEGQKRSTSGSD